MLPMSGDLYERDFHAWAEQQASLLRAGRHGEADIDHIAEEIASLGRSEKRELVSRLRVLLSHLYKWQHQPERRGQSWRLSIANARDELSSLLRDNPSLKASLPQSLADAHRLARRDAAAETGMPETLFPALCPWTFEQLADDGFWPVAS